MSTTTTPLAPTAENFRAERARRQWELGAIAEQCGVSRPLISMYLNEVRPLRDKNRRRMARAFNALAGCELFAED